MSSAVTIKIDGLEELQAKLLAMGQDVAAKNIVAGAYNATKPVMDLAKVYAPQDTGLLRESVTRKKLIYSKSGTVVVLIGVNKKTAGVDRKGMARVPWRYAHIIEKRDPFIEDAIEATKDDVVQRFKAFLERRIAKFYKKNKQ